MVAFATPSNMLSIRMAPFSAAAMVRGYQVFKDIWAVADDKELPCKQEEGNKVDPFAVAVLRDETIVGHIPRTKVH